MIAEAVVTERILGKNLAFIRREAETPIEVRQEKIFRSHDIFYGIPAGGSRYGPGWSVAWSRKKRRVVFASVPSKCPMIPDDRDGDRAQHRIVSG